MDRDGELLSALKTAREYRPGALLLPVRDGTQPRGQGPTCAAPVAPAPGGHRWH
jgi:hypothetical protein